MDALFEQPYVDETGSAPIENIEAACTPFKQKRGGKDVQKRAPAALEIWESEDTKPSCTVSSSATQALESALAGYFPECMQHPFLPRAEIEKKQLDLIRELVERYYGEV